MDSAVSVSRRGLPREIIIIVMEELHAQDPVYLSSLRLVSHTFNQCAVRLQYRSIILNDPQVLAAIDAGTQISRHIHASARHILIDGTRHLDRDVLVRRLTNLTHVISLTWKHPSNRDTENIRLPSDLFKTLRELWPNSKVHFDTEEMQSFYRLPALKLLNSFHLRDWNVALDSPSHVTGLLLLSPAMEKLHLVADPTALTALPTLQDSLYVSHQLPAVKELRLECYNWVHTALTANTFWNWTNIRHLELALVSIVKFLQTVSVDHLSQLQTFVTDGYCEKREPRLKGEEQLLASSLLYRLMSHSHYLQKIVVPCRIAAENWISVISQLGSTLRYLDIRDYYSDPQSEIDEERAYRNNSRRQYGQCPVLGFNLVAIQISCPSLMELILDHDMQPQNQAAFINILSNFRNLRRLTLHAQFCVYDEKDTEPRKMVACIRHDAMFRGFVNSLLSAKQGSPFERLQLIICFWKTQNISFLAPQAFVTVTSYAYVGLHTASGPVVVKEGGALSETLQQIDFLIQQ